MKHVPKWARKEVRKPYLPPRERVCDVRERIDKVKLSKINSTEEVKNDFGSTKDLYEACGYCNDGLLGFCIFGL